MPRLAFFEKRMTIDQAICQPNGVANYSALERALKADKAKRFNKEHYHGRFPLHAAIGNGDLKAVVMMLAYGADHNVYAPKEKNHYLLVFQAAQLAGPKDNNRQRILVLMVLMGADLNETNKDGRKTQDVLNLESRQKINKIIQRKVLPVAQRIKEFQQAANVSSDLSVKADNYVCAAKEFIDFVGNNPKLFPVELKDLYHRIALHHFDKALSCNTNQTKILNELVTTCRDAIPARHLQPYLDKLELTGNENTAVVMGSF